MAQWNRRDSTAKPAQNQYVAIFDCLNHDMFFFIMMCLFRSFCPFICDSFVRLQQQQDERDSYENDDQDDDEAGPSSGSG
jgi:hypothetical protein